MSVETLLSDVLTVSRCSILLVMSKTTLSAELAWRGFTKQTTYPSPTALDGDPITFYFGVDPSAASMTIGNLAAVMMVRQFIRHGHNAIILIGGATGMIGDPDGKSTERNLKTLEEIDANKKGIVGQYNTLFKGFEFKVVDNYDWFKDMNYLTFLRDIGKHVPMRQMLGRDFVSSRLDADGDGISYAEFSYVLIQAYDFLHLSREHGASLQLCGSDQWGNSIAGVDLIRRITGKEAHVWSIPLVVNKTTGIKFGKSEDGAVWLDPTLTSPYKFYQFWLNLDDAGAVDFLKVYTDLTEEEISEISESFSADTSSRLAQKTLAYEVTKIVHGEHTADSVRHVSEVLFGGSSYAELDGSDFEVLKSELGVVTAQPGDNLVEILCTAELASSKSEARRFLESNAIYINGSQLPLEKTTLDTTDAIAGHAVLRRGKNAQKIVEFQA